MKLAVIDEPYIPESAFADVEGLPEIDLVVRYDEPAVSKQDVIDRVGDAELVTADIFINFDREMLEQMPNIKAFFVQAVGFDQIDIEAAKELGIKVYNCPGYNANAVGEFVFSLIVNLFRKVPQAQAHVRAGGWDYKLFVGKELHGKTIGILGSGNVGQTVAKIAQGFSMNVISHTKNPSKEKAKKMFVEDFVSLRKLLRESDVVVTALPLNESTMGLISKAELNIMKKDAFLINTSRQLIVNERDLAEALVERKIAGAALDMLIEEPFNMESSDLIIKEMINMQNVIVTPHIAGVTRESKDIIGDYFLQNIQDFFSGKDRNLVF